MTAPNDPHDEDDEVELDEALDGPGDDDLPGEGGEIDPDYMPVPDLEDEDLDLGDEEDGPDEEGEDDGEEESEDDLEAPAAEKAASKKKAKKSKSRSSGKVEEDDEEVANPDTKVPTRKKMLAALEWAFENESEATPELLEKFADHALMVLEQNKVMNLTALLDPKDIAAKHYLDSWRVSRMLPLVARKILDLGTGAGFPGIPIALGEPNCSMTLVDSTRKKVEFVEKCIQKLGLRNCRAVWDRAEDHLATEKADVVVVRAVSSVRENVRTLRKVRHSVKDVVMLKGNSWSREVRAGEREAERLGFKLDTVMEHELPEDMGKRAILVYRAPGGHGL